jgi:hypothetical protein
MSLPIFPTPRFFVAGERVGQLLSRERMPANDPSEARFNRVEPGSDGNSGSGYLTAAPWMCAICLRV